MAKEKVAKQLSDENRRDDKRFYDSVLWRKVRAQVLREEPYCRECARHNIITLAAMVDHIERLATGGNRLDRANLQSLCNSCHAIKRGHESHE